MSEQPKLTYGQKAVGLTFNPPGNASVQRVKELYADIIDHMNMMRDLSASAEHKRLFSVAITEAQAALMWAVKAITWSE